MSGVNIRMTCNILGRFLAAQLSGYLFGGWVVKYKKDVNIIFPFHTRGMNPKELGELD